MKILIANRHKKIRIASSRLRRWLNFFMEKAAAINPVRTWIECSLVIVGDREMIALNRDALGHEGTTDVITFTYRSAPGEVPPGWRGEIVVNIAEASRAAQARGLPLERELALYVAHGCQHLAGANDDTPARRAAMHRRQLRWLREAARRKILHG